MSYRIVEVDGEFLDLRPDEDFERVRVAWPDAENGYDQEPAPLDWVNSAAIVVDEDQDSVTLTISVDDPAASVFGLTVRRLTGGTLVMHVPNPYAGMQHAPLTPLHAGTYRIGSYGAYASVEHEDES